MTDKDIATHLCGGVKSAGLPFMGQKDGIITLLRKNYTYQMVKLVYRALHSAVKLVWKSCEILRGGKKGGG